MDLQILLYPEVLAVLLVETTNPNFTIILKTTMIARFACLFFYCILFCF
jgi:hypothetical protein